MLFIPKSVKKKKRLAHNATVLTNTSTHTPPTSIHSITIRHGLGGLVSVDGRVKSETRIERAGVRK